MAHGDPDPVHGPFTDLGSGKRRRREKVRISQMISNGRCTCEMCSDGPRGKPENPMWSGRPGDEGEIYLCQGPSEAVMSNDGRPWA